jgi:Family of unknown function (DUF6163)
MTRISPARNVPPPAYDEEAAIARSNTPRFKLKTILLWLMRITATLCMMRGIYYWMDLIGLFKIDFNDLTSFHQIAIVLFAAIYCFAATGLWMIASWGVALWVIAVMGEASILILEPNLITQSETIVDKAMKLSSPICLFIGIFGITSYLVLTRLLAREE